MHERARATSELNLASDQGTPGLGVPQLEGGDGAGSGTGEPQGAAGFVGACVHSKKQPECPGQHRGGRCVTRGEAQSERVDEDVHGPRRLRTGRRGACRLGHLQQATGAVQVSGPQRRAKRL
jgi:hypothetical protein